MVKANENDSGDLISITIGRFGSPSETIEIEDGTTVGDALTQVGLKLAANTVAWVNGEKATANDILEDGDTVNVVTPKQAGA